jgi:hypothetical protein
VPVARALRWRGGNGAAPCTPGSVPTIFLLTADEHSGYLAQVGRAKGSLLRPQRHSQLHKLGQQGVPATSWRRMMRRFEAAPAGDTPLGMPR